MKNDSIPRLVIAILLSWCAIGVFVGTVATCTSSCGPAVSTQTRVDYASEVMRCDELERDIIAREGTTFEEDREAIDLERVRCDEARRAIRAGADGGVR